MPVGSVLTAVPFTTFFAEIKVNDGKTYIVSGSDVQNLQVGEGYSARITDGNRKLEILGKDSKSKLRQWSVVIDKVHE